MTIVDSNVPFTRALDSFMDVNWQYNNPANPADAAIGPAGYDNHLYYSFGVRSFPPSHPRLKFLIQYLIGCRRPERGCVPD